MQNAWNCRYLRDLHNCFHGGLAPTWLESIQGSKDVEEALVPVSVCCVLHLSNACVLNATAMNVAEAWTRHAQKQGYTTSNCAYQKIYSEWVKENFGQRYKTFQVYDLAKRVLHYLEDLGCVAEFNDMFGDHCDFMHENLQTLPTLQNMHSLGKIIASGLQSTCSNDLLGHVFLTGCRYLVVSSERQRDDMIALTASLS